MVFHSGQRLGNKEGIIHSGAIGHIILAATALGYGTCWIGAFNEDEVKRILKIPENLAVIALLPVGTPDESPPPRPRKAFREIFFKEFYGIPLEL